MKKGVLTCLALLFALGLPLASRAGTTEVGGGLIFVTGTHTEQTGQRATASLIPAPLLTLDHTVGRWALHLESIPPVGAVPVGSNSLGLKTIELSYLSASVRYAIAPNTRVGLGEMMYNQQSIYSYAYSSPPETFVTETGSHDTDRSRIVGAQFEALQVLRRTRASVLTAYVTEAPSLRGALGQQTAFSFSDGTSHNTRWFALPEFGSQFSAIVDNAVRENKRLTLHYGFRTVNLVMHFKDGYLADRNVFFVPFIGVSTTLGR